MTREATPSYRNNAEQFRHYAMEMKDAEAIKPATISEWDRWLVQHAETDPEVWLVLAKKGSGAAGISAQDAGDVAICHGWIDSHRRSLHATHFLQRYSPRRPGSPWSLVNVERATALEAAGRMRPSGLAQVSAAKVDGRWAAAYAPQRDATPPDDLISALAANPAARAAYERLSRSEQYMAYLPLLKAQNPTARANALRRTLNVLGRQEHRG